MSTVTILIAPRERYSGYLECIDSVLQHTPQPFTLMIPDIDTPGKILRAIKARLKDIPGAVIIENMGRIIPMEALRLILPQIRTDILVYLENDTTVSPNWLPPLVKVIEEGAAVASPLVLEKEGVDVGATLRNHLYTSDIRVVDVNGTDYLIENKMYRRELPENIPPEVRVTETYELHGVAFDVESLRKVDIPNMVMREQIDICMQLRAMGKVALAVPSSVVTFDNLNTRMYLYDMKYFFYRWSEKLNRFSADEFEKRWGYRFYSEQAICNWAYRRKWFLICKYFYLPNWLANKLTSVLKRIFLRDWDPLPDPVKTSRHLGSEIGNPFPKLRDTANAEFNLVK